VLGFVLFMERVEEPLNQLAPERDLEKFFDDASPEELDTFVREGTDSALTRYQTKRATRRPSRRRWLIGRRRQ
jgi:hypothetical protein